MTKTKKGRDLEYKVWTVRLSDSNLNWLKKISNNFDSWNLLFNDIREKYGK